MAQQCSKDDARHILASLQELIAQFQESLAPDMSRLVAGQVDLWPWIHDPDLPDDENLRFLKSLNLPATSRFMQNHPSLLLHKLGCLSDDPDYRPYIARVFKPKSHTLLVNTSGSGKTRILLEGMCLHWGFYFTAQAVDGSFSASLLGSCDLGNSIYTRLPQSPLFTEKLSSEDKPLPTDVFSARLQKHKKITGVLCRVVLLARLVLFEQFLETMHSQGLHATNDLKQRWLLLQLDPSILGKGDVFESLVDAINSQNVDDTELQKFISIYWCRILHNLNSTSGPTAGHVGDASHIFLVIDEAQHAVEKFPDAFRSAFSEKEDSGHRPVLRELVFHHNEAEQPPAYDQ